MTTKFRLIIPQRKGAAQLLSAQACMGADDSVEGAQSSAIIYSITETTKAKHRNPFRYLEYILTVIKDHQEDADYRFMEELLPWSEQLPEICKSKTTNV